MKFLEKVMAVLIVIALFFKFFFIPGGGIIFTLSLTLLAILYYPFGVFLFTGIGFRKMFRKTSYQGISAWRIVGAIAAGFAFSTLSLGILFKIQLWPGAGVMLLSGLAFSLVVLIVAVAKFTRQQEAFYREIIARSLVFGLVGLLLYSLGPYGLERFQYRNHPQYLEALDRYLENPEDEALREQLRMEEMKVTMTEEEIEYYREQDEK